MPIYEYECGACGLRFEKIKSMAKADNPETCSSCETPDARRLVSGANFAFAHTVQGGPRPQNTGVYSIDYNFDRVIGMDSAQKWKAISERQNHKREVIKDNPGSTGFDLSRTHDGDYRVMGAEERKQVEQGRAVGQAATQAVNQAIKPKQ